jgi:hypothetical protein
LFFAIAFSVPGKTLAVEDPSKRTTDSLNATMNGISLGFQDFGRLRVTAPVGSTFEHFIEYDTRSNGNDRLFAGLGGEAPTCSLNDFDGDGTVDATHDHLDKADREICLIWLPHRLIRAGGRNGCSGDMFSFEPNEDHYPGGIQYQFIEHQWFWALSGLSLGENNVAPTDVPRKPDKYRYQSWGKHDYPTTKPIVMAVVPNASDDSMTWRIDSRFWADRKRPVTWCDDNLQRNFFCITGTKTGPIEVSISKDLTYLQIIIDGQASFESWDDALTNSNSGTAQNLRPRRRIRLMNNVYHDINGDGALDGYHEYGETDAVIRAGLDLIAVAACDWELGTAVSKAEPAKRFSFNDGRWMEVISSEESSK